MNNAPALPRRALLCAAAVGLCSGCKVEKPPVAVHCLPLPLTAVNRIFLFDRTTVPPAGLVPALVRYVGGALRGGDHLQVVRCGGVTPSLVEVAAQLQMPDAAPSERQRSIDRLNRSPADIQRDDACRAQRLAELGVEPQLSRVVSDTDDARHAQSPLTQALHAATNGWRGTRLDVWTDGLEHVGPERSFYGPGGTLRLPPPQSWVNRLRAERLLPDLKGVQVGHLGIGLAEPGPKGSARVLRDPAQMQVLLQLWEAYWQATGATVRFGQPLPI